MKNGGLATRLDAATGKVLYQGGTAGRVRGLLQIVRGGQWQVCVASQPGMVVVDRGGDTLEVLARNGLGEPVPATPAIVDNRLFVRTAGQLFCFGKTATAPAAGIEPAYFTVPWAAPRVRSLERRLPACRLADFQSVPGLWSRAPRRVGSPPNRQTGSLRYERAREIFG